MLILILILHELGGAPQDMLILVLMLVKVLMLVLIMVMLILFPLELGMPLKVGTERIRVGADVDVGLDPQGARGPSQNWCRSKPSHADIFQE